MACEGLEGEESLANSAAILNVPEARRDWGRAGLALYGISPFGGVDERLKPGYAPDFPRFRRARVATAFSDWLRRNVLHQQIYPCRFDCLAAMPTVIRVALPLIPLWRWMANAAVLSAGYLWI